MWNVAFISVKNNLKKWQPARANQQDELYSGEIVLKVLLHEGIVIINERNG